MLLALGFLGTYPPAHGRQEAVLLDDGTSAQKIPLRRGLQETRNINPDGAPLDTRRILALQAPHGFQPGLFRRVAQGNLLDILPAHGGILRGHLLRRNGKTLLGGQGRCPFKDPFQLLAC